MPDWCAGARAIPTTSYVRRRADHYLTGAGFPDTDRVKKPAATGPADLHMIGKDIIGSYAVYWRCFANKPDRVAAKRPAHGLLHNRGEKMSKSVGNTRPGLPWRKRSGWTRSATLLRETRRARRCQAATRPSSLDQHRTGQRFLGNLPNASSMVAKNLTVPNSGEFDADAALLSRSP